MLVPAVCSPDRNAKHAVLNVVGCLYRGIETQKINYLEVFSKNMFMSQL